MSRRSICGLTQFHHESQNQHLRGLVENTFDWLINLSLIVGLRQSYEAVVVIRSQTSPILPNQIRIVTTEAIIAAQVVIREAELACSSRTYFAMIQARTVLKLVVSKVGLLLGRSEGRGLNLEHTEFIGVPRNSSLNPPILTAQNKVFP